MITEVTRSHHLSEVLSEGFTEGFTESFTAEGFTGVSLR
jgi:hypothetical protein